jgi:ribose 5-phosphate isomerase RpiB
MRIAVINETSAADRNADILAALAGRGHTVVNVGMTAGGATPELTYIHTGLLAAMLLNFDRVDLVVGGCGTGMGFLNSAMQYPNVFCGLIQNPLDAWLFGQINAGNCISLALNYRYGWAGDVNLRMIFDQLFSLPEFGTGYPAHRRDSQQQSRNRLRAISLAAHKPFADILASLDDAVLKPALNYPGVAAYLDIDGLTDPDVQCILSKHLDR